MAHRLVHDGFLGGLQSGTGLLLSLGKTATIASATIVLGATPGGVIELRPATLQRSRTCPWWRRRRTQAGR